MWNVISLTMTPVVPGSSCEGGEKIGGVGCYLIEVHGSEKTKLSSGFPPGFQELPIHSFNRYAVSIHIQYSNYKYKYRQVSRPMQT